MHSGPDEGTELRSSWLSSAGGLENIPVETLTPLETIKELELDEEAAATAAAAATAGGGNGGNSALYEFEERARRRRNRCYVACFLMASCIVLIAALVVLAVPNFTRTYSHGLAELAELGAQPFRPEAGLVAARVRPVEGDRRVARVRRRREEVLLDAEGLRPCGRDLGVD